MKNIIIIVLIVSVIISPLTGYSEGQRIDIEALKNYAKEQIDKAHSENTNLEEVRRQADKVALIREKFNKEFKTLKHNKTVNKLLDKAEKFCLNVSSEEIDDLRKQAHSILDGIGIGIDD